MSQEKPKFRITLGCDVRTFECCRCGEELIFTRGANDADIQRALESHRCTQAVKQVA